MAITDGELQGFAMGPGATEQKACDDTVVAVMNAIRRRWGTGVTVFAQGSYRNRTNVRRESDVDVVVLTDQSFFYDVSRTMQGTRERIEAGIATAALDYSSFKQAVLESLVAVFGARRVQRKNKCILVRETVTRVNADVVPAFAHRNYGLLGTLEATGIGIQADDGKYYASYPEQHLGNGEAKNVRVGREYKRVVRIMKRLRNRFADNGSRAAKDVASFVIECGFYNVDNTAYFANSYRERMRATLSQLYAVLGDAGRMGQLMEVNGIQRLFRGEHDPGPLRHLLEAAWTEIGL